MGSRPSAPVTYRPSPTAPVIYQSIIPDEDFERASAYVDELRAEREAVRKRREDAGYGAADMAARQKAYLEAEKAAYEASLPDRTKKV